MSYDMRRLGQYRLLLVTPDEQWTDLSLTPSRLVSRGPDFCPRFLTNSNVNEILLPNGVSQEIVLEVDNLPVPQIKHTGFQCIIEIEGAKMMISARVERGRFVVCEQTKYSYQEPLGEYKARVTVVWNRDHMVDSLMITLYKCSILGSHRDHSDCSLCITQPPKYKCSWCGNACSYADSCSEKPSYECPKPRIDLIKPLSGPVEGGTLLSIEGSNLGFRRSDVEGRIRVGDIPCDVVDYDVSIRIVCRTGAASKELDATVTVGNRAGYTQSSVHFNYRNIELRAVYPPKGPMSGGTQLAISGSFLNIGTQVTAFLDELPCKVSLSQSSSGRIFCRTSGNLAGPRRIRRLMLRIDNATRILTGNPFNYTQDPAILEIRPLKSFAAGGRLITVHGSNLDSVQEPQMVVFSEESPEPLNKTFCSVMSSSYMECPSPSVDLERLMDLRSRRSSEPLVVRRRRSPGPYITTPIGLRLGFIMDNVRSVQDLEKHFHSLRSEMLYMEDPKFFTFPNTIKLYKGDTLVIEGENLNLAADEADVNVTVGTVSCNVTSLALSQLVCTPPEQQPYGTDELGVPSPNNLPLVVVRVGRQLRFPIGYLQYETVRAYGFPPEAVGGIAAGGAFLILVSVVILVVYRRKSTQAEREYKRIQIQMDTLESNVRSECKQAFAELQTDLTDLTADLESSGIPVLPHKAYVMKVFFPGVLDHPILADPKLLTLNTRNNHMTTAMFQFDQLLSNKYFLLNFIESLEAQKSFSIRDKVNVASLLMVILMNKMDYATDVLRSLLLRLIDQSVGSKHPQLMLRRTESVVEKMLTNWMALCLYDYMKDHAGGSLFLLFKAIKYQVEKGPVDAVTHDARYSLSEERLLREQTDFHSVIIHLVQDDPHYEKIPYHTYQSVTISQDDFEEKIQVRVLDCDTISQVKGKILDALYKNTAFTLRPSIHEVDLEWRCGQAGHVILQDEDRTTQVIGGWRRLNTLAHYGVKDSAVMTLVPRQTAAYATLNACATTKSCKNCNGSAYSFSRSMSPLFVMNGDLDSPMRDQRGLLNHVHQQHPQHQAFHLVKPVDDSNRNSSFPQQRKAVPEIFLTRLLSTKGTVQKYVDDFIQTILTVNPSFPPAVKWLFDLLDDAAKRHGIYDPEVVHAWKSNSLPLRFWVNFIKNPDFMFDINKTPTVDACLSVIAQTFMDACSTTEHRLGKDSPSSKLLFAKDIPRYKSRVSRFYSDVAGLPSISDATMTAQMQQLSTAHFGEFDVTAALRELYIYVEKYHPQVLDGLAGDPYCNQMHLSHKLQTIMCSLSLDHQTSSC
ncbi:unnamed protein product [Cyprideis torosa]|uniref:Uncharacterized protein n=1 Tax=Cyprideis torosa TaxID=163714 RepID=A0A7R8ZLX0_9CRUS|nr:unnamed protein product [Cyprideis torosa]CAG0883074.1 unnamed protein product [Cyprideis torosa]